MVKFLKRMIFRSLSLEGYLRLLQRSYFVLYDLGLLRLSPSYKLHYFVRRLIRPGDTVVDIGANLGYYSILFARWTGPLGRVFSVEPIEVYNRIFNEKARRYPRITLYSYALGPEEKSVDMVSSPGEGYLRTGLPHVYDPGRDAPLEAQEFRFEARMKHPAELFASLDRIDYIKCDVEGFEYTVFSLMRPLLERHRPKLQVEVWGENEQRLLALFDELGYTPYKLAGGGLVPPAAGAAQQGGDYIFIHRDDPDSPRA